MEKKYYELIVSLIRNHRKFIGYESILDDIVEDVYNHAKVVIGSVTNEEVILSYLAKVVDTSIITVPKKLNINTRIKHRSITIEPPAQQEIIKEEQPIVTEESFEPIIDETQELQIEEEEPALELEEEQESVDKTLVDKMINGVSEEPVQEEITAVSEEIELPAELEEISEADLEEDQKQDELTLQEDSLIEEEALEPEEDSLDETDAINIQPQEDEIEPVAEVENESTEIEDSIEEDTISLEETVEDLEETNDLIIEDDSSMDLLEEEPALQEDFLEEETIEQLEEPSLELEEKEEGTDFALPNYNCFSFNPEKAEFDEQEINSEIADIESKHPEKQISRICSLKYSQNLSVSEIASTVEMSEEDVLDVLNEIIDIVKD